jgi:hypothetical protein
MSAEPNAMISDALTLADLRWIYNEVIDLLDDQDMYTERCANKCRDILEKLIEGS